METPRWLADEMLGRLARYLRFLGHDTEYVRGLSDDQILEQARREGRRLVTRDRALARRLPDAVLLESPYLPEQLRRVRSIAPSAPYEVTFDRCSLCNGQLRTWHPSASDPWPSEIPLRAGPGGGIVFECESCRHRYWEGSHTARIREQVAGWLSG